VGGHPRERAEGRPGDLCALPPVFLDEMFMKKLDAKLMWGTMLFYIPIIRENLQT
jgi:hypothetical protein